MVKTIKNTIRRTIVQSFVHGPLMKAEAFWVKKKVDHTINGSVDTIYIISPYKTGTTYIASLWENNIVQHEPFHVYSLKYMPDDFETNFKKRAQLLGLKIECSGFFSMYLDKLPQENGAEYIFVLRPPSKWVQSVMAHFYTLKNLNYNYIDIFYWEKLLGYSLIDTLVSDDEKRLKALVSDLYILYFNILETAFNCKQIYFVPMSKLDNLAMILGEKIGVKPNFEKSWKRKSKVKFDKVPVADEINDARYEAFVRDIPRDRLYL